MKLVRIVIVSDAADLTAESTFWAGIFGGHVLEDEAYGSIQKRTHRPGRRERGPELGRVGGLHDRAGSPARGRGPQKGAPADEPDDHAIGRSRGGLTTKIHLAADARCRPLAFVLTAGQAGDAPAFTDVMARLRVPRRRGRPRTRPDVVLADKA
jgi:hypothetical protein